MRAGEHALAVDQHVPPRDDTQLAGALQRAWPRLVAGVVPPKVHSAAGERLRARGVAHGDGAGGAAAGVTAPDSLRPVTLPAAMGRRRRRGSTAAVAGGAAEK